jgi:hypothetical protein
MMGHDQRISRGGCDGRAGVLLLFLLAVGIAIGGLFLVLSQSTRDRQRCEDNLKKVYAALDEYRTQNGRWPQLAYFPDDPMKLSFRTNDSLAVTGSMRLILANYLDDPKVCVCPAMHPVLREKGLTYVWNTSLNAAPLPAAGQPKWMLVEMTAVGTGLPAPHFGYYNVLYTDGSVRRVKDPSQSLDNLLPESDQKTAP